MTSAHRGTRIARAALVAVLMLSAACGDSLQRPVRSESKAPGDVRMTVKVRLRMDVTGAETLHLDRDAHLDVHEAVGGKAPSQTWFLTVSADLEHPIRTPDGRSLLFSADIAPGQYQGPGTYSLTGKEKTEVAGVTSPFENAAYVQFASATPAAAFARYDRIVQPCSMQYEEQARRGSVDCPELANDKGATVRLRWRWERL